MITYLQTFFENVFLKELEYFFNINKKVSVTERIKGKKNKKNTKNLKEICCLFAVASNCHIVLIQPFCLPY